MENFYKILGIAENATTDEIKTAYRQKLFELHPDKTESYNKDLLHRIIEIYKILSTPEKKSTYDKKLNDFEASRKKKQESINSNMKKTREIILNEYKKRSSAHEKKTTTENFDLSFEISLPEMRTGTKIATKIKDTDITIKIPEKSFPGREFVFFTEFEEGKPVKITAVVELQKNLEKNYRGNGDIYMEEKIDSNTAALGGVKKIISPTGEEIKISLKGGIKNGQTIRLKGAGGFKKDGSRGNLFVVLSVKKVIFSFKAVFDQI